MTVAHNPYEAAAELVRARQLFEEQSDYLLDPDLDLGEFSAGIQVLRSINMVRIEQARRRDFLGSLINANYPIYLGFDLEGKTTINLWDMYNGLILNGDPQTVVGEDRTDFDGVYQLACVMVLAKAEIDLVASFAAVSGLEV